MEKYEKKFDVETIDLCDGNDVDDEDEEDIDDEDEMEYLEDDENDQESSESEKITLEKEKKPGETEVASGDELDDYFNSFTKEDRYGYISEGWHILGYLIKPLPTLPLKGIDIENDESDEEVQIFEKDANVILPFSKRIFMIRKIMEKDLRYYGVKKLSKIFNCKIQEIKKIFKRHSRYLTEWEYIKLHSKQSTFSIIDLDEILYFWQFECIMKNYPITKHSIKHTAHSIAKLLNIEMFRASENWLDYFVNRYSIKLKKETKQNLEKAAEAVREIKILNVISIHLKSLSKSVQNKFSTKNETIIYNKRQKLSNTGDCITYKIKDPIACTKLRKTRPPKLVQRIPDTTAYISYKIKNSIACTNTGKEKIRTGPLIRNFINQESKEITPIEFIETTDNSKPVTSKQIASKHFTSKGITNKQIINKQNSSDISISGNSGNSSQLNSNSELKKLLEECPKKELDIKKEKVDDGDVLNEPNITIQNYEHALKYLKPIEDFVMLQSNFRAINYLDCLQNSLKDLN